MEECRDGEDTGRGGEAGGALRIVRGSWYNTDCHLLCISLFSFYEKSFSLKMIHFQGLPRFLQASASFY